MPQRRRPSRLRRFLRIAGAVSVGALLIFAGGHTTTHAGPIFSRGLPLGIGAGGNWLRPLPQCPLPTFLHHRQTDLALPRRLLPVRRRAPRLLPVPVRRGARRSPPQQQQPDTDAVLLPDNEVLVLSAEPVDDPVCCFDGGSSSPARSLGRLPGPGRHAYICPMPDPEQSIQPLKAPLLLPSSTAAAAAAAPAGDFPGHTLFNWTDKLVYDAAVLDGGDVLVFAKGVNRRQGESKADTDVQCVYRDGADGVVSSFPAITSAQQVIRCPPPPTPLKSGNTPLQVTLAVTGEEPIPSVATYRPQQSASSVTPETSRICACTMVRDVSKVLREWVTYHDAVGVDRFILYDNGSEDDLADKVAMLKSEGINISTVAWPWTKTQEAGLSHCAATHQKACQWMAFFDVDEFIFSTKWNKLERPSKSLLEPVLSVDPHIGQIHLGCVDFGPSGQTAHPQEGVSQGYTCRMNDVQRHKSLVRLDAVGRSLVNSVHHFSLKTGFNSTWTTLARVNHYKYQAWSEFKLKFKHRVSTYVADWTNPVNLRSNDRAPGLGVEAIEPADWSARFCQMKDYVMKEVSEKWFGIGFRGHGSGAEFKSTVSDETRTSDIAPAPSTP